MNGSTFTAFAAVKSHDIQNQCDLIEKASATQQDFKEYVAGREEWGINVSYLVLQNEKSNIEEKYPFSPIKSPSSSYFSLNTSPIVRALYGAKATSLISPRNSPMPWQWVSLRRFI